MVVIKDSLQDLKLRALYQVGDMQFVIPEPAIRGTNGIIEAFPKTKNQADALFVNVTAQGQTETVGLLGGKGFNTDMKTIEVGDLSIHLAYGSKPVELPFAITLNDFIAEKYPGTEKVYSSYESEITVVDGEQQHLDFQSVSDHQRLCVPAQRRSARRGRCGHGAS